VWMNDDPMTMIIISNDVCIIIIDNGIINDNDSIESIIE